MTVTGGTVDRAAAAWAVAVWAAAGDVAAGLERAMGVAPYYDQDGITIFLGDCRDILPTLEAGSIDLVLTDPPYSDAVHGKSLTRANLPDVKRWPGAAGNRSTAITFAALDDQTRRIIASHAARLCRSWVIAFTDIESANVWRDELISTGLDYVRTGAWIKLGAMPQITGDRPGCGLEAIVIAHQPGRKRWNGGGSHAVWQYPIVLNRGGNTPRVHPTEKPLHLMRDLVAQFSNPDDLILDPFMGSGTTLRAAKDLGRRAIGIELSEEYCQIAVRRLQQQVLPLEVES